VEGDFRERRVKATSGLAAAAPPGPEDLIDENTWRSLAALPDDVALRTSEHHGGQLGDANKIREGWETFTSDLFTLRADPGSDPVGQTCLLIGNEFQASCWAVLSGYYRQAIASLRTAMEFAATSAYFRVKANPQRYDKWREGRRNGEITMKEIRETLEADESFEGFEPEEIFGSKGWVNSLYGRLSGFVHARPSQLNRDGSLDSTSNTQIWKSTGPVYAREMVPRWFDLYAEVALLSLLLVRIVVPRLDELDDFFHVRYLAFLDLVYSFDGGSNPVAAQIVATVRP
jgi:hypothetical protein